MLYFFQFFYFICGRCICQPLKKARNKEDAEESEESDDNSWPILLSLTLIFCLTYPVHLYVAEVHLVNEVGEDSFRFLMAKYGAGFLFVVLVPMAVLATEAEIRRGVKSVFGSAVVCLQDVEDSEQESQVKTV